MASPAQSGSPVRITAKEWNDVRAATQIVLGGLSGGNVFQAPRITDERLSVRVINSSGADRQRFKVLAIDGMRFNLADDKEGTIAQPLLKLRTIEGDKDRGNVCVLQSPMKTGKIHPAVFSGLTAAWVNVSDSSHEYIDVGDEPESFISARSGGVGRIVWKPGTGSQLCVVLISAAGGESSGVTLQFEILADSSSSSSSSSGDSNKCSARSFDAPGSVRAKIITYPCGSASVAGEVDGEIVVHDINNSFLAEREAKDLEGKTGFATLVSGDGLSSSLPSSSTDSNGCIWAIIWIDWFRWVTVQTRTTIGIDRFIFKYSRVKVWDECELDDVTYIGNKCGEESSSSSSSSSS